jgi:hypothetical protein
MSEPLIAAAFIVVGVIHALPVVGVLSRRRIAALYDVDADDPSLAVLLRHRAVLFGVIAGLQFAAAASPSHRPAALVAGLVSVLSFLALAPGAMENVKLRRVFWVDVVALAALVTAAVVDYGR